MRNGTSQSPFRPALGRQLVRAADAPLRGHGFGTSRLRQTPTTNGLTAYRMRLHLACVSSGTYGPFATSASRSRLRLPRTTRLALRASLAGSGCRKHCQERPVCRTQAGDSPLHHERGIRQGSALLRHPRADRPRQGDGRLAPCRAPCRNPDATGGGSSMIAACLSVKVPGAESHAPALRRNQSCPPAT